MKRISIMVVMCVAVLCILGICVNSFILGPDAWHSAMQGRNDFRAFYIGGLIEGNGLYDTHRLFEAQQRLFGEANPRLLSTRIPIFYAFFRPLAHLPYMLALTLWLIALIVAVAFAIYLETPGQRAYFIVAMCWSLPLLVAICIGQDIAMLVLFLAAAGWSFRKEKPLLGGLLLSLCLVKFHLMLLVPWMFLLRREWRALAGLCAGAISLVLASFVVAGENWPGAYMAMILNPEASPSGKIMPNLHAVADRFAFGAVPELVMVALILAAASWTFLHASSEQSLAVALACGLLISRHTYLQDCALLVIPLVRWALRARHPYAKAFAIVPLIPMSYLALLMGAGWMVALLFLLPLLPEKTQHACSPVPGMAIPREWAS